MKQSNGISFVERKHYRFDFLNDGPESFNEAWFSLPNSPMGRSLSRKPAFFSYTFIFIATPHPLFPKTRRGTGQRWVSGFASPPIPFPRLLQGRSYGKPLAPLLDIVSSTLISFRFPSFGLTPDGTELAWSPYTPPFLLVFIPGNPNFL